jgi:hypothetical protein
VIRVGRGTEVEVKERKDRVDDAMHATKAAVEEGVVAGGGVALHFASKALAGLNPANSDQQVGIEIVRKAVQSPVRQIADNSGTDGSIVVGKLTDKGDPNFGYPAVRVCMWTGLFGARADFVRRPGACHFALAVLLDGSLSVGRIVRADRRADKGGNAIAGYCGRHPPDLPSACLPSLPCCSASPSLKESNRDQ